MILLDAHIKAGVLDYVGDCLPDRAQCSDPAAVILAAGPVVDWLEQAGDDTDLEARRRALRLQWRGLLPQLRIERSPDLLLSGAQTLYAYTTATSEEVPS